MRKIYLAAIAATLTALTVSAMQPSNLQPGLRMVISTCGQMDPSDRQHLEGLEPGEEIDGYETLRVWGCDLVTGEAITPYSTIIRTEGSKVYCYQEMRDNQSSASCDYEIDPSSHWQLLYDFDPTIGEEFTVLGFPGWLHCRCVEVTEEDPEYYGLKTLTMELKPHHPEDEDYYRWETEKWVVGVGSPGGLLYSGFSLLCGGGGHSIRAAFYDDNVLFESTSTRRYYSYTVGGYSFKQATAPEVSVTVGSYLGKPSLKSYSSGVYCQDMTGMSKARVLGGMYVSGNQVYYANYTSEVRYADWRTIYDFSLMPGEITKVTRVYFEPYNDVEEMPVLGDVWVECLSVEPYEHNPSFTAMHLMAYADRNLKKPIGPTTWIKGIGSLHGLLNNCPYETHSSTMLSSVNYGSAEIFSNPEAGVPEISALSQASEPTQIYDLSGRRVPASPDALAPGVYILRDGGGTRKVLVK